MPGRTPEPTTGLRSESYKMKREYFFVDDREGNAVAGAEVYVKTGAGALVTIYSDNGLTTQTNPMSTDNDGKCNCFVADGTYTIEVWIEGVLQQTILGYQIFDESTVATESFVIACS